MSIHPTPSHIPLLINCAPSLHSSRHGRAWACVTRRHATDAHPAQQLNCAPCRCTPPPLQLALPYWMESEERMSARWKLAGVFALTLGTTGVRWAAAGAPLRPEAARLSTALVPLLRDSVHLWPWNPRTAAAATAGMPALHHPISFALCFVFCSVLFNFLNRDFFNALSAKDQAEFTGALRSAGCIWAA